jgi:hypothetical protein
VGTYLVETYLSRDAPGEPDRTIGRTVAAVDRLVTAGRVIRYLRAIFVPDDETCLLLFEAASIGVVREAAEAAGLDADRVARTVVDGLRHPADG